MIYDKKITLDGEQNTRLIDYGVLSSPKCSIPTKYGWNISCHMMNILKKILLYT